MLPHVDILGCINSSTRLRELPFLARNELETPAPGGHQIKAIQWEEVLALSYANGKRSFDILARPYSLASHSLP